MLSPPPKKTQKQNNVRRTLRIFLYAIICVKGIFKNGYLKGTVALCTVATSIIAIDKSSLSLINMDRVTDEVLPAHVYGGPSCVIFKLT